jgi:hypothetical protein
LHSHIPIFLFFVAGPFSFVIAPVELLALVVDLPLPYVKGCASSFSCSRTLSLRGPRCAADIGIVCKGWRATRVLIDAVFAQSKFRDSFASRVESVSVAHAIANHP